MKKIYQSILLSCLKATLLVEKKQLQGLTFQERIQLKGHLALCEGCKTYQIQSKFISEALTQKIENNNSNITISQEDLDRMKAFVLAQIKD